MIHVFESAEDHPYNVPNAGRDNDYMNARCFPEGHTCLCGGVTYANPDAPHRRVTHPPYSDMFKKILGIKDWFTSKKT